MLFRTRRCYCSHARLCELFSSCKTFVPELPSALAGRALECSCFLIRYPVSLRRRRPNERCENESTRKENQSSAFATSGDSRDPIAANRKRERKIICVRFVLRVVFVKARRTLFKSWEDGARVVGSLDPLKDLISFKRPLKKVKQEDLSDTGYGVDQHLVPFAHVPTVDVIVRALRDGQHVVLIHLFG